MERKNWKQLLKMRGKLTQEIERTFSETTRNQESKRLSYLMEIKNWNQL